MAGEIETVLLFKLLKKLQSVLTSARLV